MYIAKSVTVQELPSKLEEIFNENGWDSAVKFRVKDGTKYADVRLFSSYGTDYEMRKFGMAFGYDTSKSLFNDNRIISETSELGTLGIADGITTSFYLKASPVDKSQAINVYVNGALININSITITGDVIEFNVPPNAGDLISVSYRLDDTAPEPPTFLAFFTYGGINLLSKKAVDAPIKLADGDGVKKVYKTPTAPIKVGTLKVWNDSIPQIEGEDYTVDLSTGDITFTIPPALGKELTVKYTQVIAGAVSVKIGEGDGAQKTYYTPVAPIASIKFAVSVGGQLLTTDKYTVDFNTGEITFNTAPEVGKNIVAKYVDLTGGPAQGQVFIEDIIAEQTFNPVTPLGTMEAVYRALDFIQPSIPTVLSFSEAGLGNAWQRDSKIHIKGQINCNAGFFHLRADAGANAIDALYAPLYFGRMLATHKKPTRNFVMFAGASTSQEIKWKAGLKIGGINVDYGPKTSNGNSSVLVAQTIGGAYYQHHYLKYFTHSKDVDNGEGVFNPSKYLYVLDEDGIPTPAYTISRMRLTHPNDGDLYELEHMYAMHPEGIGQQEMMRISELGEWETIGFGDGYKRQFILSRNKHKDSAMILQVNCIERSDYKYDPETRTVTFDTPIEEGMEVIAFYGYKQEYQFHLATTPRCPTVIKGITPYAPIGTLTYKKELE